MRIYLCDESAKERSAIKKCVDKYLRGNYQVSIKEFGRKYVIRTSDKQTESYDCEPSGAKDKRPCDCTKTSGEKE